MTEQQKIAIAALHLWTTGDLPSLLETAGGYEADEQWILEHEESIRTVEDDIVDRIASTIK